MIDRGLVERKALLRHFEAIEPRLFRFPNIDPAAFRRAVQDAVADAGPSSHSSGS
jgi:hypothetical protein